MACSTAWPASAPVTWARVNHASFAVAIVVLVLNDRVLKEAWPGAVTGKLSDAAGLFLLGAISFDALDRVGAPPRWRWAPTAAVVAPFAAVKLSSTAAAVGREGAGALLDAVGAVLGWLPVLPANGGEVRIVTDPTDLLVVPAIALPLCLSSWPGAARHGDPTGSGSSNRAASRSRSAKSASSIGDESDSAGGSQLVDRTNHPASSNRPSAAASPTTTRAVT